MLIVIVARAMRDVLGVAFFAVSRLLIVFALRGKVSVVAARAVVVFGRVVPDDVARDVVAERTTVFFVPVREVVAFVVVDVARAVVFFCALREIEFASRTAASAGPTPRKSAVMRYITFLILNICLYFIKNVVLFQ